MPQGFEVQAYDPRARRVIYFKALSLHDIKVTCQRMGCHLDFILKGEPNGLYQVVYNNPVFNDPEFLLNCAPMRLPQAVYYNPMFCDSDGRNLRKSHRIVHKSGLHKGVMTELISPPRPKL